MTRLQVVGAGGLGREVLAYLADIKPGYEVTFLDDTPSILQGTRWAAVAVRRIDEVDPEVPCLIAVGDPGSRARLAVRLSASGAKFTSLIHPRAWVATTAEIGLGCIVAPFASVGPQACLAAHVLMGPYASIGHDSRLGAASVLSPYATLNGAVDVGAEVFLGTHAVVTPGRSVGKGARISAGSVVFSDLPETALALGNPARWRCDEAR